jgi:hypothetical protein
MPFPKFLVKFGGPVFQDLANTLPKATIFLFYKVLNPEF